MCARACVWSTRTQEGCWVQPAPRSVIREGSEWDTGAQLHRVALCISTNQLPTTFTPLCRLPCTRAAMYTQPHSALSRPNVHYTDLCARDARVRGTRAPHACALAEPPLPLGRQGGGHEGEVALVKLHLLLRSRRKLTSIVCRCQCGMLFVHGGWRGREHSNLFKPLLPT